MRVSDVTEKNGYTPPSSSAIAAAQNEEGALRLLLSQRRLYNKAKWWARLRSIGFSVIAVAAPVITAIWSGASVAIGAIAGVWIFLARVWFLARERYYSGRGAVVQEMFDLKVYGMPQLAFRDPHVSPEEISRLVGDQEDFEQAIDKEHLRDWYPIDQDLDGTAAIAIAQRANAAYTESLLRSSAFVWLCVMCAWAAVAVIVSLILGFSLPTFLLGVAAPLLPALLDVLDQWKATRQAERERRALAQGIEECIRQKDGKPLRPQDLLVWQEQLYTSRRDTPQIPKLVYWRTRTANERDMNAAASELAGAVKSPESTQRDTGDSQ